MHSSTDTYRAVSQGQRRQRGRYRANAVQPRTSSPAHTSVCVSYKLDEEGNKVEGRIFTPKREHISRTRHAAIIDRRRTALDLLILAGNNSDVD